MPYGDGNFKSTIFSLACHAGLEEPAPDHDPGASMQLESWIADQVRNDNGTSVISAPINS
jgi:hypothetical protein